MSAANQHVVNCSHVKLSDAFSSVHFLITQRVRFNPYKAADVFQ